MTAIRSRSIPYCGLGIVACAMVVASPAEAEKDPGKHLHHVQLDVSIGMERDDADKDPINANPDYAIQFDLAYGLRPLAGLEIRAQMDYVGAQGIIQHGYFAGGGLRAFVPPGHVPGLGKSTVSEIGVSLLGFWAFMSHYDTINGVRLWTGWAQQISLDYRLWDPVQKAGYELSFRVLRATGTDHNTTPSWFLETDTTLWFFGIGAGIIVPL